MPPSERAPILTAAFLFLMVAHFLQALGYASMVLLPLYLDHLHATRGEIGAIMAAASVGGIILRPAIGWALDRFGRKSTLIIGTLCLVGGMCGFWFVTSISPLVYAVRVLLGIGTGALFTGYFTFASDLIPESRRTEGLALFGISGLTPLVITPIAGAIGIDPPELRWFFPLLGGLILLSLVPLAAVREVPKPSGAPRMTAGAALQALRRPSLFSVWIATTCLAGLVSVFMAFATVTAENRGVASAAIMWVTYAGGAILIRLAGSVLLDRIGAVRLVPASLLVYAAAFGTSALADSLGGFLFGAMLAGLGHGLGFPVLASQVVGRVPEHLRGSGVAALTALWEIGALVLTPIFGLIADASSDAVLFYAGAAFSGVCLALWWPLEARAGRPSAG